MRGSHVLIAALLLAVMPAPASAQAPDANEVCAGGENQNRQLVVVNPLENRLNGTVELHPETTLYMMLCGEDGPLQTNSNVWMFHGNKTETVDVVETDSSVYTLRVRSSGQINLAANEYHDGANPAGSVTVRVPATPSHQSSLTGSQLKLRGDTTEKFAKAESGFISNDSAVESRGNELQNIGSNAESNGKLTKEMAGQARNHLSAMNLSYQNATKQNNAMKRILHSRLWNYPSDQTALTLLNESEEREQNMTGEIENATNEYTGSLKSVESNAQGTVLMNTLLGILIGLVIGVLLGAYRPYSKAKEVKDFQHVSSSTKYEKKVIQLPFIAGVLITVLGILFAILIGIVGVLV